MAGNEFTSGDGNYGNMGVRGEEVGAVRKMREGVVGEKLGNAGKGRGEIRRVGGGGIRNDGKWGGECGEMMVREVRQMIINDGE